MDKVLNKMVKLSDMPVYEDNPFNEALITKLNSTGKTKFTQFMAVGNKEIIDKATGEVMDSTGHMVMGRQKVVDSDEFTKVYFKELKNSLNASKGDMQVLIYLSNNLEYNQNFVLFDIDDCIKQTMLSDTTIYRSLANLCDAGIIARSDKFYKYFINPVMMFKGDRITLVDEYIRKGSHNKKGSRKQLDSE